MAYDVTLEELRRVKIWGQPFHGLAQGGQVTLPNSAVRATLQPDSGDCYEVRVPGTPPVTRSPAEYASDVAAGREFRDYALLSGSNGVLYQKSLGPRSWLYCAPDGKRWLMQAALPDAVFASGYNVALTAKLFGEFARPAQTLQAMGVCQDVQQTTSVHPGDPYRIAGRVITGSPVRIEDISADGAKVILAFITDYKGAPDPNDIPPWTHSDAWEGYRLGYLLLTLSGSGATLQATLTVLRSRTQTLGTETVDTLITTWQYWQFYAGASPSLVGPNTTSGGGDWNVSAAQSSVSGQQSGRIAGMCFDEVGQVLDIVVAVTVVPSYAQVVELVGGQFHARLTSTHVMTFSVTLNGRTLLVDVTKTKIEEIFVDAATGTLITGTVDESIAAFGDAWSIQTTSNYPTNDVQHVTFPMAYATPTKLGATLNAGLYSYLVGESGVGYGGLYTYRTATTAGHRVAIDMIRYANRLVGIVGYSVSAAPSATLPDITYRYCGLLSRGHVEAVQIDSVAARKDWSSYQPVTGQVARNGAAVQCWI